MTTNTHNIDYTEWQLLLESINDSTIYHTPEWKKFLESTFAYEPYYLFKRNDSGELTGLLPLFYIKDIFGGARLCSTPFAHDCGPIGTKEACNELIVKALDLCNTLNIKNLEVRAPVLPNRLNQINNFSSYILPLSFTIPDVWHKLDKSSVRWAITKAKKSKVTVDISHEIDDWKQFYELNCLTKKALGVPSHPWIFFKNLYTYLNDKAVLYTAKYDKQIIGGGIMINHKNSILYGYGAADSRFLNLHPYNAVIWKSIEDACVNNYKNYDFGRSSYDNEGLIRFKKRWGAIEKKLFYSYYQTNPISISRKSLFYRLTNIGIQIMPMSSYKLFSKQIFGNLG